MIIKFNKERATMKNATEDHIQSSSCRVTSFSVKPDDTQGLHELETLKLHATKTGTKLSYYILLAIKKLNKELGLHEHHGKD